ncbi:MAG: putative N-acetylmannosamine-6-phosphate 2-epimerase [Rhodoferax sp.]|nr:putative N-acetylmannosamine-6-phosphate 2-epimerase [Rhodoferax sp.]
MLQDLQGGLIASCQPLPGSPMDRDDIVLAMALAAQAGGASAVRIEGSSRVRLCAQTLGVPIIGIVKRDLADSPVRITPWLDDVQALLQAGAAVIAVDATRRARPVPSRDLLAAIHGGGALAMADASSRTDGLQAWQSGFDLVGTTLSGYTAETACADDAEPDWDLIRVLRNHGCRVVAEGRIREPRQAHKALQFGAYAVTVGSAITRIEHLTAWYVAALAAPL